MRMAVRSYRGRTVDHATVCFDNYDGAAVALGCGHQLCRADYKKLCNHSIRGMFGADDLDLIAAGATPAATTTPAPAAIQQRPAGRPTTLDRYGTPCMIYWPSALWWLQGMHARH